MDNSQHPPRSGDDLVAYARLALLIISIAALLYGLAILAGVAL